jgi:hypothetical protein
MEPASDFGHNNDGYDRRTTGTANLSLEGLQHFNSVYGDTKCEQVYKRHGDHKALLEVLLQLQL